MQSFITASKRGNLHYRGYTRADPRQNPAAASSPDRGSPGLLRK
jgi:hypothetical protein